jgi:type IV pilus assembly protein PilM
VSPRLPGLLDTLLRRLSEPDYPLLAVEVRPRALGVVRVQRVRGRLELGAAVSQDLPEGCLKPSLSELNLAAPDAFQAALRAALERAGALGAGRACLVLPDLSARVALVPAGDLHGKRQAEASEVVRFRLRKSLPFDAREARLSWQRPSAAELAAGSVPVVAAARTVIEQYEAALAALGLHAGLIELCGLVCLDAALRGRPSGEDRVVVNWDEGYVSLLLTRAGRLAMVRTLELSPDPAEALAEVQREAFNTLLYYRERLGGSGLAGVTLRSALLPADEAAAVLAEPFELVPEALDPWSSAAGARAPSGFDVPGGLAAALATVLGRAA